MLGTVKLDPRVWSFVFITSIQRFGKPKHGRPVWNLSASSHKTGPNIVSVNIWCKYTVNHISLCNM